MTDRMGTSFPTEKQIRSALIERMKAYCKRHDVSPSTVCLAVMNDTMFFSKVLEGRNFTVESYQKIQDFLTADRPPVVERQKNKKKQNGHKRRNGGGT